VCFRAQLKVTCNCYQRGRGRGSRLFPYEGGRGDTYERAWPCVKPCVPSPSPGHTNEWVSLLIMRIYDYARHPHTHICWFAVLSLFLNLGATTIMFASIVHMCARMLRNTFCIAFLLMSLIVRILITLYRISRPCNILRSFVCVNPVIIIVAIIISLVHKATHRGDSDSFEFTSFLFWNISYRIYSSFLFWNISYPSMGFKQNLNRYISTHTLGQV